MVVVLLLTMETLTAVGLVVQLSLWRLRQYYGNISY